MHSVEHIGADCRVGAELADIADSSHQAQINVGPT
jgi:hypothetical protein